MLIYKYDVLKDLNDNGFTSYKLTGRKNGLTQGKDTTIIGGSQLQKLRNGDVVGINVLETICRLLNKQPGEIIEYIDDERYEALYNSGYFKDKGVPVPPPKKK